MKQKSGIKSSLCYVMLLLCLCAATSCVNTKKVTYFQNMSLANQSVIDSVAKYTEPVIQNNDILSVTINTVDPETSAIASQSSVQMGGGTSSNLGREEINGFMVNKNGEIQLSVIGKVKVAGLTTFQAQELIETRATRYLQKPIVNVRFANFRVSVIGEVSKPASYSVANEKATILDVISLAGDLTIYGKRENISVIRDVNGKKTVGRLNLNSTSLFASPYYYLKQNDVIYVEPNKAKVLSLNSAARTTVAVAISAISTIVLIITRL